MDEIEVNGIRFSIADEHEEIAAEAPADEEIISVPMYGDLVLRPVEQD